MSKVFSISLATVLMLINIVGPMQPASVMDDTPQETTLIVDETLVDDASGSEEAVVEASGSVEPPPADNDEIVAEEEDVSPVEEPAEQSNSPPVEDPMVEKDEIEDSEPNLVAPSAIDPDPGDCGGLDQPPCSGSTEPVPVDVSILILNRVYEDYPVVSHTDATVTIKDASGAIMGDRHTAAGSGWVTFSLVTGRTYTLDISAPGSDTISGYTITPTTSNTEFRIELPVSRAALTLNVTDAYTGDQVSGAIVNLYDTSPGKFLETGTANPNGTWVSQPVPINRYFRAEVHLPGYFVSNTTIMLTSAQTINVELEPRSIGSIEILVIDMVTGSPVPNADILVMDANTYAHLSRGTTSSNGIYVTSGLPDRDLLIDIESNHHVWYEEVHHHPGDQQLVIELQPYVDGRITVNVLDRETGDPIANAYVTVMESWTGNEGSQVAFGRSNDAGQWTSPELPGDLYFVSAMVEGYLQNFGYVYTDDANVSVDIELELVNDAGLMQLTVYDDSTGHRLSGVNITVRSEGVVGIGRTDSDGVWSTAPLGRGTYEFTLERTGFRTQTFKHVHGGGDEFLDVNMQHVSRVRFRIGIGMPRYAFPDWSATRLVSANGLMIGQAAPVAFQVDDEILPVTGATVRLLDPDTREVIAEEISDDQGFVEFDVPEGNYILQITGEGFQEYSQPVTLAEDLEIDLVLEPLQVDDPNPPGDGEPGDGEPGDGEPGDGEPGDGEPGDGEPGDGEPGDGEPGDGEPGDGNPDDGSNPDPGNPDDGSNPGTGNPDDGSNPDPGIPDDGSNPDPGNPDEGSNPDPGNPDEGSNPDPGSPDDGSNPDTGNPGEGSSPGTGNPGEGSNPDTGNPGEGSNPGTGEEEAGVDNDVAESGSATNADAVAQSSGASTDTPSGSVNQLPNTGAGESKPNAIYAALTLVAAFFLLGALGVRRSTR